MITTVAVVGVIVVFLGLASTRIRHLFDRRTRCIPVSVASCLS